MELQPLTSDQIEYLETVSKYPSYDPSKVIGGPNKSLNMISKAILWEQFAKQQPQLELKVNNYFSHGVYARELEIPKDTILTGEIHRFTNLNILAKGKIKVSVDDEIKIIEAPYVIVSPPGTKRIAHTLTDCVWITIHGTFETDINKIKEHFIADDLEDWLEFSQSKQLELF